MFRFVVLALAVAAASATPGYLGGAGLIAGPAVASPVLASRSIAYGGLAAPIATGYGINGLGYSNGLAYGSGLAYGNGLAYGHGLGLRSGLIGAPIAAAPLGYGVGLRSAAPLGLAASPLGLGYAGSAYGVGAYGLAGGLIH